MSKIRVYKIHTNAILPKRNHSKDAGLDLFALSDDFIEVGTTKLIQTGVAVQIPTGFVGKIEDRSSMALRGLRNGGGIVDAEYTGDCGVILHNLNNVEYTDPVLHRRGYRVRKGERVGQILLYRVEISDVEEVTELWNSERQNKGYGSSGK